MIVPSANTRAAHSSRLLSGCLLSTVPRIKDSPIEAIPAENTRSSEVMQKCDIDWPICSHEPVRGWVNIITALPRRVKKAANPLPVSVTLKKNVIVITEKPRGRGLAWVSDAVIWFRENDRTVGEAQRDQEDRERRHPQTRV
jgi:hypothetical protein